jgi:hypothetical protein
MTEIRKFTDFGIKPATKSFVGSKIEIEQILNTEITVHEYRIVDSKFTKDKGNNKCLHIQISIGTIKHVIFTGSNSLMDMIQQVPDTGLPFSTKIIKESKQFQFT